MTNPLPARSVPDSQEYELDIPLTQIGAYVTEQRLEIDRLNSELGRLHLDMADLYRSMNFANDQYEQSSAREVDLGGAIVEAMVLIEVLREIVAKGGGSMCDECEGTGGDAIMTEYTSSGAWSPADPTFSRWGDPLDDPCERCGGAGCVR